LKLAAAVGVGAAVGLGSWWLGLEVGVPVVLGVGAAGGLFGVGLLRVTAQRMTAEQQRGIAELRRALDGLAELGARRQDLAGIERRQKEARIADFTQLEALLNLHRLVPVQSGMPPTRGWAASPDLLLLLVSLVEQHRPATIVDLGSGSTTLWMASTLRSAGIEGRVIAFDHDATFAQQTRDALVAHGLEKFAEVRHAPLTEVEFAGEQWPWYALDQLTDVSGVDLLVIDGPPGTARPHARYPALPVLADRLTAHAHIVLDDYGRTEETEMVDRWQREFPGWTLRKLSHEKGTAVLSRD
jgi:predicted O-methyltransferase YrrM